MRNEMQNHTLSFNDPINVGFRHYFENKFQYFSEKPGKGDQKFNTWEEKKVK